MIKFVSVVGIQQPVLCYLLLVVALLLIGTVADNQDHHDEEHSRRIRHRHRHHNRYLRQTTTATSGNHDYSEVLGGIEGQGRGQQPRRLPDTGGITVVVAGSSSACPSVLNSVNGNNCIELLPVVECGYGYVWMGSSSTATTNKDRDEEQALRCLPKLTCKCNLFNEGKWTCRTRIAEDYGISAIDGSNEERKGPLTGRGQICTPSNQEITMNLLGEEVIDNDTDLSISTDDKDDVNDETEVIEQKDNDNDVATSKIPATENEDGNNNDNDDDIIQTVSGDNPDADDDYQVKGLVYHATGGGVVDDNDDDDDDLSISSDDKDDVKDETEAIEQHDNDNDVSTSTITATENEDGNDENDDVIQIVSGDNPEADDDYKVEVSYVDATTGVVVDVDDDADTNSMSVVNNSYGDDLLQIVSGDNPELDDDYKFALTATENEDGNNENDDVVIQMVSGDNPEAEELEISYFDATKNNGYGDDLIQIVSGDNSEIDDDYKFALAYGDVIGDENNSCQTIPELLCGEGSVEKFTTVCDWWKDAFPDSKDKKATTTMTLFAPTDQAFQLMEDLFSKGENNYSLTNEEYLEVFQFHVVPGRTVLFENLLCGELLAMSSSKKFSSFTQCNSDTDGTTSAKIQRGGGNRKNNIEPMTTTSDIRACHDSVIHIINEVMLPNFIDQFI